MLQGRRVICHVTHDPAVALERREFAAASRVVTLWVARSRRAEDALRSAGLATVYVPYMLDAAIFRPLDGRAAYRDRHGVPAAAYAVGSFQRDTEGADLRSPKLVKGPDVFVDIVDGARKRGVDLHVVLAGPRRFWIRQALEARGVPYTYVGRTVRGDDVRVNTLSRVAVNELYNAVDLYLVSSRSEGGPQAVLEAAASRCRILSTDVGHARDILSPMCLYRTAEEAIEKIVSDAKSGALAVTVAANHAATRRHLPDAVRKDWREAYTRLMTLPPVAPEQLRDFDGVVRWAWRRVWA
jgi:glycosyltransferase involved in cell wall biosynthesis